MTECPRCESALSWRNAAVRCLDCGLGYCKECPDYRWGRFQVRCPECGCEEARAAETADDFSPPRSAEDAGSSPGAEPRRRRKPNAPDASPFAFE